MAAFKIQEVTSEDMNESPSKQEAAIRELRQMLQGEKQLYSRTDAPFLLRFLRARKLDVDRAFQLIKNYYNCRRTYKEVYDQLLPSQVKKNLVYNYQSLLPHRDHRGRAVLLVKSGAWDPGDYSPDEMFKTNTMCMEQAILDPDTQINGVVMINDLKGLGLHHVRHCPPSHFIKVIHLAQDGFPAKFKALHIVNEPFFMRAFMAVLMPFMKEKFRKRIFFHGNDMTSLHQHISPDALPREYGGTQDELDNKDLVRILQQNEQLFKRDAEYGYKEK
ncbi:alpha-tocopherol transfer protein-like [Ornithodoros turicata]